MMIERVQLQRNHRQGAQALISESDSTVFTTSCSDNASWPLMICLLGNFRLLRAGALLPTRAGGKSEALLSLLALQASRRVSRERLIQAIWPASDPELGRNSLNNQIHNLHKLLGSALNGAPAVVYEDGYYRLNVEAGIGIDITCFDQLLARGDQQMHAGATVEALIAYRRAAELYRDDLRLGQDAQILMERERLRSSYLTLLARLAEYHYRADDYSGALEYLWRLLGRDPYREDAHRLVMRCYVRRGKRAAALRQYQVCAEMLRANFGAEPEAATVALYEQLRIQPDQI